MSLDYPILPICQTAESFRNILSAMGPYRDSISLKKSPLLGLYTGSEAQLDLATVRYHALGAYAKSVYLVTPSPCTPVKTFFYSFSLLKYRYEISIVDISTLLKNIDIDIDIDMEKLKISISISISIGQF